MLDSYRDQPSTLPVPELRMSPAGVIAIRDLCREPGWTDPHWTVIRIPAGDVRHHVGQHLVDQAVAAWSPLVRRTP